MIDQTEEDEKIIAVAQNDPSHAEYTDISQLPKHILIEIRHFFEVYKTLENKTTMIQEILGKREAVDIIEKCIKGYEDKFLKK